MPQPSPTDRPLVRISCVASRYLIFDIDDVMFLRRHHNLCSVFSGTVPQNPQQNVFMGLPVELMAEEARALVDDCAAYVVEDDGFHIRMLTELTKHASLAAKKPRSDMISALQDDVVDHKNEYLHEITEEGTAVMQAHLDEKQALREASLMKASKGKKNKKGKEKDKPLVQTDGTDTPRELTPQAVPDDEDTSESLFGPPEQPATSSSTQKKTKEDTSGNSVPYAVTPTITGPLLAIEPKSSPRVDVEVPPSYPLFKHLHDKGYYMMPGLRFGCDYNVYPGDPLRFHAHFQATSYDWDEEINMMDLTAGGRLGTGVKKGWLVGGQPAEEEAVDGEKQPRQQARAFCLEWAGM